MSLLSIRSRNSRTRTIYPVILIPLLALMLIVGMLAVYFTNFAHAAPAPTFVPIAGAVPALVARSKQIGPVNPQQQLSLSISLRLRNESALKNYVDDMSRPKSANYHRYLTLAQLAMAFLPAPATHEAVLRYLQDAGFTITHTYTHRMQIDFTGTVAQAEQVFHVQINTYKSSKGETFYANATNPLLPSSLAGSVQMISGLSDALHWTHTPLPVSPHHVAASGSNALFCPGYGTNYYTPDQIQSAYNLNGLYNQGYHGEGQTVALFELDTFQISDLTNYETCYGHSHTPIYTIVAHGPVPTDGGVVEVELDAELVLSAAPKLGQLRIYESSNDTTGINDEWAKIIQDNPSVISTSWGSCESDLGSAEAQTENGYFILAAAQGETVYAASGDTGSTGCIRSNSGSLAPNAGDPASQPYVTSVGGSSLTLNGTSSYGSETVWNNSYGASGGGISQFWTENPNWLNVPGVQNQYSSGVPCGASSGSICREEPDVSLNADPNVGYLVYCTSSAAGCSSQNPWQIFGGTSAAAPMWAAMTALADEKSVKNGGFNLGFITPLLYSVAANSTQYSNDFHDVTTGNNDYNNYQGGLYPATTEYDMATGLGSYNAANLAQDLIALNGQRTTTPAKTLWYFAEGSVGGGFTEYLTLQNPNTTSATVTITYLLQSRTPATVTKTHTINPSTRATYTANSDLSISPNAAQVSVAAIVSSSVPIVAERPMYFNFHGIKSGTDVIGATTPQTSYYFPYGTTTTGNYTYITLLNPSQTQSATVTLTYYTGSCTTNCPTETKTVGSMQRQTASPTDAGLHQNVAIAVSSTQPIVAERPMYVNVNVSGVGQTAGAASVVGATSPGTNWLFAEGYTASGFQEYLNLANFSGTATTATVNLEYTNGYVQSVAVNVPAYGQTQFNVNANARPTGTCNPSPCNEISAQVTSTHNIVVDRLMYFHYGSTHIPGITEVVGAPAAASIYAFAEGYTGGSFTEYLTLQNPGTRAVTVAVTLFTQGGLVLQQQLQVGANSRGTLNINNIVNPIGSDSVSLVVQVIGSGQIVAERPLYFNYYGDTGATDVIGYTGG